MSRSPYSFVAFIDESGDEGFNIAQFPERKSSEWFVLSALIFRTEHWGHQSRVLGQKIAILEQQGRLIHFATLKHEQRLLVVGTIAESLGAATSICIHKSAFQKKHTLDGDRRLYFYSTRMLIERISWYAKQHRLAGQGNGQAKLVFAHCKNLSYERMKTYLHLLRNRDRTPPGFTQINWQFVDVDHLQVLQHKDSIGLRLVDAVASGTRMGLELTQYGYCEERYARLLRPCVYHRNGNYASYGLKFFPKRPPVEPQRDNRYAWIHDLF